MKRCDGRTLAADRDGGQRDAGSKCLGKSRAHRITGVDDGMLEPRHAEQALLGERITLDADVVIEMIAAQIAECGDAQSHAVDASLVECMRRDFHGDVGRPGIRQRAQLPVQRDDIGCRQCGTREFRRETRAKCAEIRAAASGSVGGVREQPGAGGLAIGAGHARHCEPRRGRAVESIGDGAEPAAQRRHWYVGNVTRHGIRCAAFAGIPQHGAGAGGHGLQLMFESVATGTTQRNEGIALADGARIKRETGDRERRRRGDAREQSIECLRLCGCGFHGVTSATVTGATRARSSGATDISLRAPDITAENTGAATSPP